jgi:hypothetical protein
MLQCRSSSKLSQLHLVKGAVTSKIWKNLNKWLSESLVCLFFLHQNSDSAVKEERQQVSDGQSTLGGVGEDK